MNEEKLTKLIKVFTNRPVAKGTVALGDNNWIDPSLMGC